MNRLSNSVWAFSKEVVDAIKQHPFNQELVQGTLSPDKFAFYIEQDSIYLGQYARCLAMIASKAPNRYIEPFLRFSHQALIAEQELVHFHFKKVLDIKETNKLSPATLSYTSYLLCVSANDPIEVAIAAVLPCFWIYYDIGVTFKDVVTPQNPYKKWMDAYTAKEFHESVHEMITIFDEIASQASPKYLEKMKDAFYKGAVLEW